MAPTVSLEDRVEKLTAIVVAGLVLSGQARDLRRASGLSPSELGAVCGVSAATVTEWESCLSRPAQGQSLAWLWPLLDRALSRSASMTMAARQPHGRLDRWAENRTGAKAEHEAEVAAETERVSELDRLRRKAAR